MSKSTLSGIFLAASLAITPGDAPKVPEQDPWVFDERTVMSLIHKYIDETSILNSGRWIKPTEMSSRQKDLAIRFIYLRQEMEAVVNTYSNTMDDIRDMETRYGDEKSPRITRLDYVHELGELNSQADAMAVRLAKLTEDILDQLQPKQIEALYNCRNLYGQRQLHPVWDKTRLYHETPSVYMSPVYTLYNAMPRSSYEKILLIEEDLRLVFQRNQFKNLQETSSQLSLFKSSIDTMKSDMKIFQQEQGMAIANLKQTFMRYRHKELLMRVNLEYCGSVLDDLENRQDVFSTIPQVKKQPSLSKVNFGG